MKKTITICDKCEKEIDPFWSRGKIRMEREGKLIRSIEVCIDCLGDVEKAADNA